MGMTEREGIIESIERVLKLTHKDSITVTIPRLSAESAVFMLKEQEPMKPDVFMDGRVQRFACKKCGKHLLYAEWGRDNYCSKCGQEVKWQ